MKKFFLPIFAVLLVLGSILPLAAYRITRAVLSGAEPASSAVSSPAASAQPPSAVPSADAETFLVEDQATGQVLGSLSVYNALLGEPQQKTKWQGLELSGGIWEPGYCIGQKWWGKGFTTEALQAVVDFWFRQVGGAFLTCCHAVQNPASGRVMEKAGFVYHHNDVYHKFDGTPVECRCYLLTKERYDNRKDLL